MVRDIKKLKEQKGCLQSKTDLSEILDVFQSEEGQLAFMSRIYNSKDRDTANFIVDHILNANPSSITDLLHILEIETEHFIKQGLYDRAKKIGTKLIDMRIGNGKHFTSDLIISWGYEPLALHTLAQITIKHAMAQCDTRQVWSRTDLLNAGIEIALVYDRKKVAEPFIRELLKDDSRTDKSDLYCLLEEYDTAIDNALEQDITKALYIARMHKPERIREVAEKAFEVISAASNEAQLFVILHARLLQDVAGVLERQDEAKDILVKVADAEITEDPKIYLDFVKTLVSYSQNMVADNFVYGIDVNYRESRLGHQLIPLYNAINNSEQVEYLCLGLTFVHFHVSDLKIAYQYTKNSDLKERILGIFESEREYGLAEKCARLDKNIKLARKYHAMAVMTKKK